MAGHGWAQTAPRVGGTRLAQGRGPVGSGWGSGGAGERASVGAMRRRGQHEGGGKSPIGGSPRLQWATRRMGAQAAAGTSEMTGGGRMRQAGQARAAGRKARSAMPHAAAAERPGGAGNIFAPCVISGSSTRKRALGGKIRAPCIQNRPIAPGNGCMGRGRCHSDLEEHAFRADVARKGAFFVHSAKKGCIRCDSCQSGPWGRRNAGREMGGVTRMLARGGRDAGGGARWARQGRCGRDFPMTTA